MSELKRKNWKKVSNRRAKAWRTLNRSYSPIPASLKASILIIVVVVAFLVPMYTYWEYNVLPLAGPVGPHSPGDPFTLLWNGTITDSRVSTYFVTQEACPAGACPALAVNKGDLLVFNGEVSTQCGSVSDTLSSTWTAQKCQSITSTDCASIGLTIFTAFVGSSGGMDTVTASALGGNGGHLLRYQFINSVASISFATGTTSSSSLSLTDTVNYFEFDSNALIEEDNLNNCVTRTVTYNSGQTQRIVSGADQAFSAGDTSSALSTGTNSFSVTYSGGTRFWFSRIIMEFATGPIILCPSGYNCILSQETQANFLNLIANSTTAAVTMTTSPINVATSSSKELLFFETVRNITNATPNKGWGWFLTSNSTLPTNNNFNPLNDTSVAFAEVQYPSSTGQGNTYVYERKSTGQNLLKASGLSENPYSNCPQTATIFLCSGANNVYGSVMQTLSSVMNYTGNTGGTSQNSFSLLCTEGTMSSLTGCSQSVGTFSPCTSGAICSTQTFPWLNVQSGNYYLGFWSAAGQLGTVQFGTANQGTFMQRANAVYYWVPNPTCPPTCAQTDTGNFIGYLSGAIGGAVNTVGKVIQNAATWVQNTALGPIGDVLQGMISWLINQVVNFLNLVGGIFLNNNSLGTQLFASFNNIIGIVTKVLVDFVTWFTQFGSFVVATVQDGINIFANTIVFGILGFFATQFTTLISIVLTVITTFFSYSTPTSYLLAMDWIWGIMMVYVIGVSGFSWWVDINVQFFTWLFKMMWHFIEAVWSTIIIIKSFIPTEGGTPGTIKNPVPQSGGRGGSGSQSGSQGKPAPSKPSDAARAQQQKAEKRQDAQQPKGQQAKFPRGIGQGAKDGDPFAIMLMSFLIVVLLFWLSQAAFSPIATVQTAGCWAWSTNCHVQNGITVGSLDTTVFFSYLFSTSHGIFVIFTLFVPLVVIMFARWFQNNVIGQDEDDEEGEGNMFFNW